MNFEQTMPRIFDREGVYSNDPRDPGGETVYGVSRVYHPHEALWELVDRLRALGDAFPGNLRGFTPLVDAVTLFYRREFWDALGCDLLPDAVRDDVFDFAVNAGPTAAAVALQRSLGVAPDGRIGPVTREALAHAKPAALMLQFHAERLAFYATSSKWATYGKGWVNRTISVMRETAQEVR